jgi:dTMP kinase
VDPPAGADPRNGPRVAAPAERPGQTQGSRSGWFVTFEGPEGSGKTIQAARLRDLAAAAGIAALVTREPGGTAVGELIRGILMNAGHDAVPLGPRTDALLFNAARAQHVSDVLRPALERGELVICARYADSTLAYQGYGSGLPIEALRELERLAIDGLRPDLTVLLDLAPEIGLARKGGDELQRFESGMDLAYHRRVRAGFQAIAADEPDRVVTVDAGASVDAVFDRIRSAVSRLAGLERLAAVRPDPTIDEPRSSALRMDR